MSRFSGIIPAILLAVSLTACGAAQSEPETLQIIAMDTAMTFTAYGEGAAEALQEAGEEVRRLDKLLSRTDEDSVVSQLNRQPGERVTVGAEVRDLLSAAVEYAALTNGTFDMTVAPVVAAWGFTTDSYQVPGETQLRELLACVGSEHITLEEDAAMLEPGTQVDLGGIAKGYASDRIAEVFRANGVEQGWVALGGNVLARGSRSDGTPWRIGIQDPFRPHETAYAGIVELQDAFAVTSGSYQRYFEENGTVYHHIIDPSTGYPADSGLVSVTVVADGEPGNGTMCDALSTALFVMGEDAAVEFWRSGVCAFEMILVTEDGRVVLSGGLEELFTVEGDYVCETVS